MIDPQAATMATTAGRDAPRLVPGLVSGTFRQLGRRAVARACQRSGLRAVAWSGDVHVPAGDLRAAVAAREDTEEAGLAVGSYCSYLRLGSEEAAGAIPVVVETADALGAPAIRVWAGAVGSAVAGKRNFHSVVDDCRRLLDATAPARLLVGLEFHRDTLVDTSEATLKLLQHVDHPRLRTLWQPPIGLPSDEALRGLEQLRPWLLDIHVFNWKPDSQHRRPLAEAADEWTRYLSAVREDPRERYALIEFVPGDDPAILSREARTLRQLIARSASDSPRRSLADSGDGPAISRSRRETLLGKVTTVKRLNGGLNSQSERGYRRGARAGAEPR